MKTTISRLVLALFLIMVFLSACGPQPTPGFIATRKPTKVPPPTTTPEPAGRPTAAVEPPPLTSYRNAGGLFAISYPTGWSVDEQPEQVIFADPTGVLKILIQFSDAGQILDEQGMRGIIDGFFSPAGFGSAPGFKLGEETVQADGSVLVEYTFDSDLGPAHGGSFFEQHGTVVYILSFWALDANQWDANIPTFNAALQSFRNLFTSQIWGIEMEYPLGWEAQEKQDGLIIQKDEETFLRIFVTAELPSPDPVEAEWLIVENTIAEIQAEDPNAKVTGPDTLVLGGEEAVYADFVYIDSKTNLENNATVIGVVYQNRAYEFLLFTLTTEAAENTPLFMEILMSVQFIQ